MPHTREARGENWRIVDRGVLEAPRDDDVQAGTKLTIRLGIDRLAVGVDRSRREPVEVGFLVKTSSDELPAAGIELPISLSFQVRLLLLEAIDSAAAAGRRPAAVVEIGQKVVATPVEVHAGERKSTRTLEEEPPYARGRDLTAQTAG